MEKKPTIKYLDRNGDYQYATVKDIGDIDELLTPIKTDLVSAINAIIEGGLGGGGGLSQEWIDYINGIGSDLEDVMSSIDAGIFSQAQLAEIQKSIDYANAEIKRLLSIDFTAGFDQIREEYDTKVQEINNNVDGVTNNLEAAKKSLESVQEHLSNVELNVTTVTESVDYVKGELLTKVDSTTFELLEATVNENSTEISQNAEEIKLKASQSSLDLATQDIQQLQADFSVTAEAIEGAVKKSELIGELDGLDIYPPTLLRGSRDWWEWESTIPARAYVKSETYQHTSIQEQVGFNAYLTKELTDLEIGKTYVASIWIKSEATHAKPVFKIGSTNHFMKNNNTSDEYLSNIWNRYSVSFVADKETVIVGFTTTETVSGDIVQFAGGKVEIGAKSTGWREHEDDNHNRLVVAETTVRQTAEGIAQIAQRQTEIDGEIEEQQTQLNQTSEKIDLQASELTQHGEDIAEMSAELTVQADAIKSKVSQTDINKSIGDIKLDNRNGILNSDFSQGFDNWSGISSVFKIVKIGNKNYAQASRTGLTGDIVSTMSSNMIQAKNGQRIMIGMDIIVENISAYDNKVMFALGMYDINDVRVATKEFKAEDLGISFQNGVAQRVNANYEINREDVAKVQLRLTLYRNGTVSYTNITLQRGDIGSTDWTPAPEDIQAVTAKLSTEIIQTADKIEAKADKSIVDELTGDMSTMNATIEAQAEQIGLRVTKVEAEGYAKDAADSVEGRVDSKITALSGELKVESDRITAEIKRVDDQQVSINSLTQTADETKSLIANQDSEITQIKQSVNEIDLSVVKKDKIIAGINASTEKDGTGTLRLKGDRILIDGNTSFKSDLVMDGGIIRSKDNGINIDLNKGEMNLSRPLTINAKPVATKDDVSSLEQKYEGQSLLDKTEFLSGAEIFTDKADDSVVHVDIDGKSVGGGSGKNIVLGLPYQSYSSNLAQGRVRVPVNFDSMKSNQGGKITFSFEARSSVGENASIYVLDLSNYTSKGYHVNNISIGVVGTEWKTYTVTGNINTNIILDNIAEFTLAHNSANPHDTEVRNIQIEIGSIATAYEPPAPTPDYPIEIHNLNDFDVVSQKSEGGIIDGDEVGGRNLYPNTYDYYQSITFGGWQSYLHYIPIGENSSIQEGDVITWSGHLRSGNYELGLMLDYRTTSGGYVQRQSNFIPPNSEGKVYGTHTVPKGARDVRLAVRQSSGSAPTNTHFYKELKIEKGNKATDWTPAPEDVVESENHQLIDKANISLSEPLRSIGDVKDRLFRDSDGLWKIERNVSEHTFTGSETFDSNATYGAYYSSGDSLHNETIVGVKSNYLRSSSGWRLINGEKNAIGLASNTRAIRMSILVDGAQLTHITIKPWLTEKYNSGNPLIIQYLTEVPSIEILPQELQDKLSNIASYKDSNYLYTIVDKTNILPEYVRDNLKPTLHATFKGGGWYARFKTEQGFNQTNKSVDSLKNETIPALKDGLLNSSEKEAVKQSLNVVSADKKGIDTQFTTVYANTALTGTAKTNLHSAKVTLNTAFANLQVAINAVLGVGDGTRITTAQMTLVTTRLNEYGTALSTYNQRYEQAQDAISSAKEKASKDYALAQAALAETQAKAHADGKITAEEERAIADAKAKLDEAKKYVDDVEVGGRNLIVQSNITRGRYLTVTGGEATDALWFYTDFIPVSNYKNLVTSGYSNLGNAPSVVYYNSSKVFVKGINNANQERAKNITIDNGISFIRFSGMIKDLPTLKLEKGSKATDWTPAPEDVETAYKAVSKAERELAEVNAKAYADGAVSTEEKRAIADAKAKLDEAKKYVDDLEVGGRNLLANSGATITNGAYNIARYDLTIPPSQGDSMTVTIKGKLASTKSHFGVYNSGGSVSLASLKSIGGGLYTRTFNWTIGSSSNTYLNVYAFTNAQVGESTIEWIKLEKGNKATDWTPAPEDVQTEIDNKANQEDLSSVEDSLNKLYTVVNDLEVQTIKNQLAEYQGILSGVEADSQEAKTQLDRILSEENGALAIINTILDNFNQRWTTLDGFIEINSSETALSISKGNTNMVIDSDSLTFYSGRTPVATITNQYMKIDRGIFVESMQVGRHLWAPSKDNRDHFVLSYSGDAPS